MSCGDEPADSSPYKPGSIRSIQLHNFMCHESFELELGSRVNFIIGPNGSGKSAILAAIMFVLGGRATNTSRAKKNCEFICYGKTQAKVTISIHNFEKIWEKDKAFKPEDYGKFIIVEKIVYKDNEASKLIIRNDKGKKISERKQELDEILEHFGILINNPICILNQEVSKTFLHSKRPEDKFELFMKATNLEQIEQDYLNAKESHRQWDDCNNRKTTAFRLLDKEYEGCRERCGFLENRAKLEDTLYNLELEQLCAVERDQESKCDIISEEIVNVKATLDEITKDIESKEQKIKQYTEDLEDSNLSNNSLQRDVESYREREKEASQLESEHNRKRVEVKQSLDHLKRQVHRLKEEKQKIEKAIEEAKQELPDKNPEADIEKRKLEIERLEREIPHEQAREKSINQHNEQLNSSMNATRAEIHAATLRQNEINRKLYASRSMLMRLKNSQENNLRKYGDFFVKIKEEIESADRQGRFKKKPVGPLGYHIKLKSQAVAGPLEIHLGKNSYAFACDNHQDMSVLQSIFRKISVSSTEFKFPTIITRCFAAKHDVSKFKADHHQYMTLLDYLDIDDPAVYNALVDRANLESVLFIPDYKDAESIMIDRSRVPRNTRCAYTKDCSVMYPRTEKAGYRSFANNTSKLCLFTENNVSKIRDTEREISMTEEELRGSKAIIDNLQKNLNDQKAEYDRNLREVAKLLSELRKKEEELLNLKTMVTVQPQGISNLEEDLKEVSTKIDLEMLKVESSQEKLTSVENELRAAKKAREDIKKTIESVSHKRKAIADIIERTKKGIKEAEESIKQKRNLIERRQRELNEKTQKRDDELNRLAELKRNIPGDVDRPEVVRATDVIKEEIQKVQAQLRLDEEDNQDPEEVLASLKRRMKVIEDMVSLKNANLSSFALSSKILEERQEGFNILRKNTIHAVATTFSTVMRAMNMNGELKIHLDDVTHRGEIIRKARTLEMRIDTNYTPSQRVGTVMSDSNNNSQSTDRRTSRSQPAGPSRPKRPRTDRVAMDSDHMGGKENEVKMTDARSLSGGERSFSTVAFVLALWHHCQSPFKLMDEIDVFMDMVTRRVSYNALIRYAQTTDDPGQFIFFSPLELPKIDDNGIFVRVFEMPSIERTGAGNH